MLKMLQDKINIKKFDIYSFVLILLIFGLDRVSKVYVIELIQSKGSAIFLYDFLNLTLNWNTGIAFGILSSNANILYHSISALILLIIIYLIYLMVTSDNFSKLILAFIVGGAVGNLFDRLTYFAVPDFIDFHINNYHWFTFNAADIFITIGIFLMIIKEFFISKKA